MLSNCRVRGGEPRYTGQNQLELLLAKFRKQVYTPLHFSALRLGRKISSGRTLTKNSSGKSGPARWV